MASAGSGNIQVVCRVRPINQKELDIGNNVCVEFYDEKTIGVKVIQNSENNAGPNQNKFAFDRVFNMSCTQEEVYRFGAQPVVQSVLEGFNGTVFAYGQTSAGKTHTMQGKIDDPNLKGIIPRMVTNVFEYIEESPEFIEFTVKVSIVEIYMEKIRDLLSPEKNNLKVKQDKNKGIYIEDVTDMSVTTEAEVYNIMRIGNSNRAVCATNMNEGSSRSHLVFMLSVYQKNLHDNTARAGKLFLIDLAGSEKVGKTGATGQSLQEAKDINKSLSALGNVINALTDGKGGHIPYRDSKLTRILQESLGGNSRTALIIACSPSSYNDQETLSTLRFGYRAKSIKNKAKVNKEMSVAELQKLLDKAEKNSADMTKRIELLQNLLTTNNISYESLNEKDLLKEAPNSASKEQEEVTSMSSPTPKTAEETEKQSDDESSDKEDSITAKKGRSDLTVVTTREEDSERVKDLELELNAQRENVRVKTDNMKELKTLYEKLTMKAIITEKENEKLIYKLASMTLKIQNLEETIQNKESENRLLGSRCEKLVSEVEELKKLKKQLTKELKDKDAEASRAARLKNFFNIAKGETDASKSKEEEVSFVAATSGFDKKKKELATLASDFAKRWLSGLNEKVRIENLEAFQELASIYRQKLRKMITSFDFEASFPSNDELQELKKKIEELDKELDQERKKTIELTDLNTNLSEEYRKLVETNIPNIKEIEERAINDALKEERNKINKERENIYKELQRRVEKTAKLEASLEKEKDKNTKLESKLRENERTSEAKIEDLETSLGQLLDMVKTLSPHRRSNSRITVSERKPKDRAERIYNIEKQLLETQELVNGFKKTYDQMKEVISETGISNISMEQLSEWSNTKQGHPTQYKELIRQEIQSDLEKEEALNGELILRKSLNFSNPRIVKQIRGGNRKSLGGEEFLNFFKPINPLTAGHIRSAASQSFASTPVKVNGGK